ncbi:MAG TPA: gamma-glutamylcyclotransferase family protein [Myxococcota bacterium]|nr:gamma-glutamylcyclotransferase family protein [Myxococcota bacterium]
MQRRVFVYGSLRNGQSHAHLLARARPDGPAITPPAYRLLDLGAYPGLVDGGTTAVVGEVVWVSAALLRQLDAYEGHPHLFARRVLRLADATTAEAYFLVDLRGWTGAECASGDWARRT